MGTTSKDVREQTAAIVKKRGEENEQNIAAIQGALDQQAQEIAAAQQERVQAQNEAQRIWQQRMDEGDNTFAGILSDYRKQIDDETAEMNARVAGDQKAAKYTGFAELGAALANLIGVGGYNASNQQYKTYSQDWMKKADQDRKEHRSRIDNLRDRQRSIEMQRAQLRMGNAGTALANAQKLADQALQDRLTLSQARSAAAVTPAQLRMQAGKEADQLELNGLYHAASLAQNEASLAERRREHQAELRAKGFNPDGTPNEQYLKTLAEYSTKNNGSTGNGNYYDFVVGGQHYRTNMSTETYKSGIPRGKEELKKDLLRKAGFTGSWEEFTRRATGKYDNRKAERDARKSGEYDKFKEYAKIVRAINGEGTEMGDNTDYIRSYVEENKNDLDNFNAYMISVAGGGEGYNPPQYGYVEETPAATQQATTTAAPSNKAAKAGYGSVEEITANIKSLMSEMEKMDVRSEEYKQASQRFSDMSQALRDSLRAQRGAGDSVEVPAQGDTPAGDGWVSYEDVVKRLRTQKRNK